MSDEEDKKEEKEKIFNNIKAKYKKDLAFILKNRFLETNPEK